MGFSSGRCGLDHSLRPETLARGSSGSYETTTAHGRTPDPLKTGTPGHNWGTPCYAYRGLDLGGDRVSDDPNEPAEEKDSDSAIFGLSKAMRDRVGEDDMFPAQITPEEAASGFTEQIINNLSQYAFAPRKIRIAALELPGEKIAVKTKDGAGSIVYGIWDAKQHRPVEHTVYSLAQIARIKLRS